MKRGIQSPEAAAHTHSKWSLFFISPDRIFHLWKNVQSANSAQLWSSSKQRSLRFSYKGNVWTNTGKIFYSVCMTGDAFTAINCSVQTCSSALLTVGGAEPPADALLTPCRRACTPTMSWKEVWHLRASTVQSVQVIAPSFHLNSAFRKHQPPSRKIRGNPKNWIWNHAQATWSQAGKSLWKF